MKDLFAALSNVQSELRGAAKESRNPFYKSKYSDLQSTWEACRDALVKNGFCVVQTTDCNEFGDYLVTTLGHKSGESISGKYPLKPIKPNDPQALGSALSYARRYSLAAIVGVYSTDDDGESAMGRPKKDFGGHAAQPEPEDGNIEPRHYKIPFGKFAQRTLEQVGVSELRNYVSYLEKKARTDGQEIDPNGVVGVFIKHVEDFVSAFENDHMLK